MAIDYGNIKVTLKLLASAQDADKDTRDAVRAAHHFVDKSDGQWEPDVVSTMGKRPRYTFDKVGPVIDQIAGEMDNADFTLTVKPAGGEASKDNAKIIDGIIRNIRNISGADKIFEAAGRAMVTSGMDGWKVVQKFVDADSMDQDLVIQKVHNWVDRIWFDHASEEQDHSDARHGFELSVLTEEQYVDEYGKKRVPTSVDDNAKRQVYTFKPDRPITIAKIYYKKPITLKLVRMTNGAVFNEESPEYLKVVDDMAAAGVKVEDRRLRDTSRIWSRLFDGKDWLSDAKETVFDLVPLCATYGNFKITENKRLVRGAVEKLMDPQRVYNYAKSRQIEEGALAPKAKLMMTREQAGEDTESLKTMNTNNEPVQFYTHVDGQQIPFQTGGAQINQGLQALAMDVANDINATAGLFAPNMADNPGLQSGVAIDRQIQKGDNGTTKWFSAQEIAICYTGKVLLSAIPRAYDATRQVRTIQEDGSFDMQTLNQRVFDKETQKMVDVNNLQAGVYDVTCSTGPAFASKRREATAAIESVLLADPTAMDLLGDVFYKNLDSPGMDIVSERKRALMLAAGSIPEEQWTDEEKAKIKAQQEAAANQPQAEDPAVTFANAEMLKAQTDAQALTLKNGELQLKGQKLELDNGALRLKQMEAEFKARQSVGESDREDQEAQADIDAKKAKANKDNAEADQTREETKQIKSDTELAQTGVIEILKEAQKARVNAST